MVEVEYELDVPQFNVLSGYNMIQLVTWIDMDRKRSQFEKVIQLLVPAEQTVDSLAPRQGLHGYEQKWKNLSDWWLNQPI